jgi:hypothetical protein
LAPSDESRFIGTIDIAVMISRSKVPIRLPPGTVLDLHIIQDKESRGEFVFVNIVDIIIINHCLSLIELLLRWQEKDHATIVGEIGRRMASAVLEGCLGFNAKVK